MVQHSRSLRITSDPELIAAVPYLLGFHPEDSIVVVAFDREIIGVVRADLPTSRDETVDLVVRLAEFIAAHSRMTALVGYGTEPVDDLLRYLAIACQVLGVPAIAVLRVTNGQFFPIGDPDGPPPQGTPIDPAAPVAVAAIADGMVALPDRAALAQLLAPVGEPHRTRMRSATNHAAHRLTAMLAGVGPDRGVPPEVLAAASAAYRAAADTTARGDAVSDTDAAWLTWLLTVGKVRDRYTEQLTGDPAEVRLWTDLTRRAAPEVAAPTATILAIAAYYAGDGATANIALSRAFDADPDYRTAQLLADLLTYSPTPAELRKVVTGR